MAFLNNISEVAPTQVIAKGIQLNDVLKQEFLEEIKKALGEQFEEIVCSNVSFQLIPKIPEPPKLEGKKEIEIRLQEIDSLRFEHPTQAHYKDKVVVVTTNRRGHLEKLKIV